MNIKRDITPLLRKIYITFKYNRITTNSFEEFNLNEINNFSNYTQNNNLFLYKNMFGINRKNWEAQKLFIKYLAYTALSEIIPIGNLVIPLLINLRLEISNIKR